MRVNFLIVGAQKAGTTALARFMGEHPDICMARRKEIHVFDAADYDGTTEYCDRRYAPEFPDYRGQRWVGEATPVYMYFPYVAERIHRYNPEMRLIVLLRNPVDRAISHYEMEVSRRRERLGLAAAIAAEGFRRWRDRHRLEWTASTRVHSYVDRGFYSRQIQQLLKYFSRDQLLVLKMEDLRDRHADTLARVYEFLPVPRPPQLPEPRHVRPVLGADVVEQRITVSPLVRALLKFIYRGEIRRLEDLLGWQLPAWR